MRGDSYPVPALVQDLDADEVPEHDFWPDGATVGSVRDPFVDCDYCYELIQQLNSAMVTERVGSR